MVMTNSDLMSTSDPVIKITPDLSEIVLDLSSIQPRLHKRLTAKVKARQMAYIFNVTEALFGAAPTQLKPLE